MLPTSMLLIREYVDACGGSPFGKWLEDLDARAAAKVTVAIARIETGNLSNVKSIGGGVLEYRIDWGPGYRVYFGRTARRSWSCSREAPSDASSGTSPQRRSDGRTTGGASGRSDEMALTRDFKETVQARASRDPAFRQALLQEAVAAMLEGDLATGKAVLRDYINATIGFEALGRATGTPPKSLMRMLGPHGNPQASNLLAVLAHLQRQGGFHLEVRTEQ
jgi:putative addiction module killer protein